MPKASVKGVVARGRTVKIGDKYHGPGSEITLPEDEMHWLQELGYVVDPNANVPEVISDGSPTVATRDREGPHVSRVAS